MTEEDIHNFSPSEETTKQPVDNYGLLFPKFFTPTITDEKGGKVITWNLIKGPKSITGWVYLRPPKMGWINKPIMPTNHYTITHVNLNRIHEFMKKYLIYDTDSHTKIRQYFINESMRLIKDGGIY